MTINHDISKSICKNCEFRFRRVFLSSNIEELIVDNDDLVDNEEYDSGDNIVIMNICLVSEMDLDLDSTIECTHYKPKSEVKVPFFKHM